MKFLCYILYCFVTQVNNPTYLQKCPNQRQANNFKKLHILQLMHI